jgi:hypothetical protein
MSVQGSPRKEHVKKQGIISALILCSLEGLELAAEVGTNARASGAVDMSPLR